MKGCRAIASADWSMLQGAETLREDSIPVPVSGLAFVSAQTFEGGLREWACLLPAVNAMGGQAVEIPYSWCGVDSLKGKTP
jgi:hypothetical protein